MTEADLGGSTLVFMDMVESLTIGASFEVVDKTWWAERSLRCCEIPEAGRPAMTERTKANSRANVEIGVSILTDGRRNEIGKSQKRKVGGNKPTNSENNTT